MCEEKQREIDRILKGYRGDKKGYAKEEKRYQIALIVETIILLFVVAFGKDGLTMVVDLIKGFIT